MPDRFGDDFRETVRHGVRVILVPAAKGLRDWMQRGTDKQQSGAFGAVELMGADRNHVGVELVNVGKRLLAQPLDGVRVKNNAGSRQTLPRMSTG